MLRTAELLPLEGLSTLGFDPARFHTEPPACYPAYWQLLGTGLAPAGDDELMLDQVISTNHLQLWAHERSGLG